MTKSSAELKYQSPKILLLDTSPDIEEHIAKKKFDTAAGSFGHALSVKEESIKAITNETMPFDWADRWVTIIEMAS